MVWFVFEGVVDSALVSGTTYYDLLVKTGSPLVGKTVVPGVHEGNSFAAGMALRRFVMFCLTSAGRGRGSGGSAGLLHGADDTSAPRVKA